MLWLDVVLGAFMGFALVNLFFAYRAKKMRDRKNKIELDILAAKRAEQEAQKRVDSAIDKALTNASHDLTKQLASAIRKARKEHTGSASTVDVSFSVAMMGGIFGTNKTWDVQAIKQMELDIKLQNSEIDEVIAALQSTPIPELKTLWRAKYGEGLVDTAEIMNDAVGAALFELLSSELKLERIYNTYDHTLKIGLIDAGN